MIATDFDRLANEIFLDYMFTTHVWGSGGIENDNPRMKKYGCQGSSGYEYANDLPNRKSGRQALELERNFNQGDK